MFRYAVSNWIYHGEPLEITCSRLQRAGFHGIELVGEPDRYDPDRVIKMSTKFELSVVSVLSWCLWPMEDRDLAHKNPAMRKKAVEYICRNIDLATAAGAPVVVVIPCPAGRTEPHGSPVSPEKWQSAAADDWKRAVESVNIAARYALEKEVIVAVEPINRFESFLLNGAAQGARFIKEVGLPNVKLHLDTFHMNIEDPCITSAVKENAGLLVNMHLSDSNRRAIGKGHFDFRGLLHSLKQINYQGALVLEPLPAHPNPFIAGRLDQYRSGWDQDLEDSLQHLRALESEILPEADYETG